MTAPLNLDQLEVLARAATPGFWSKVDRGDGCWEWCGKINRRSGYGEFRVRKGTGMRAHRVAWAIAFGPIPDGLWVLHHCDNRRCVKTEPDARFPNGHLWLGTHSDNMRDAKAKGRIANHAMRCPPVSCPKGHSYSIHGTRPGAARKLACRVCVRERSREYQARRRALSAIGGSK